jgi:hypothetical protein
LQTNVFKLSQLLQANCFFAITFDNLQQSVHTRLPA